MTMTATRKTCPDVTALAQRVKAFRDIDAVEVIEGICPFVSVTIDNEKFVIEDEEDLRDLEQYVLPDLIARMMKGGP